MPTEYVKFMVKETVSDLLGYLVYLVTLAPLLIAFTILILNQNTITTGMSFLVMVVSAVFSLVLAYTFTCINNKSKVNSNETEGNI